MIGGEIGRPESNSTGPGTPMPMPHSRPGMSCVVRSKESNSASTRSSARSGTVLDPGGLVVVAEDPAIQARDGHVDAGRAEVGDQDVPGVRAEGELPWRSSAGARADVTFAQQPAIDQLLDPSRDDRAAEAGPFHELGARSGPSEADLVEHRDESVEDLVGKRLMRPDDRRAYQLRRPLTSPRDDSARASRPERT